MQAITRALPVGISATNPSGGFLARAATTAGKGAEEIVAAQANAPRPPSSLPPIATPMPLIDPGAWLARGEVLAQDPMATLVPLDGDALGEVRRATYRSISGLSGAGTEVTGTFFVPKGTPPPGGWPVIAIAHSTTGMTTDCAPSLHDDLLGFAPSVALALSTGKAVALTDYEGLGGPGVHPYLEPRTEGFNVIDSVRALRAIFPDVSTQWLALGHSQGGQAAWAANEMNAFYGDGLNLVGVVALAPAANVSGLAELAYREQLTPQQLAVMSMVVSGAQFAHPGVPTENLLHGATLEHRELLIGCSPERAVAVSTLPNAADAKPSTRADANSLATSLQKMALPMGKTSAPMLVAFGSSDEVVLAPWVREAVERSCALGATIESLEVQGASHAGVGENDFVRKWIDDRFAGEPAGTNCGRNGGDG